MSAVSAMIVCGIILFILVISRAAFGGSPGQKWEYAFEGDAVPPSWQAGEGGALSLSSRHFKDGRRSLRWDWNAPGAGVTVADPAPSRSASCGGFRAWIYNEEPVDAKLRFRFGTAQELKEDNPHFAFPFGLDFSGWRAMWIDLRLDAENPDYRGEGDSPVRAMEILSPDNVDSGSVFLDLVAFADSVAWHRTADRQVPFVNRERGGGRYGTIRFSRLRPTGSLPEAVTPEERRAFRVIAERYEKWVFGEDLDLSAKPIRIRVKAMRRYIRKGLAAFDELGIARRDGAITGTPLFASRSPYAPGFWDVFQDVTIPLAMDYRLNGNASSRDKLMDVFDHLHDQGWAAGSGLGTLDHQFLRTGGYAHALYLVRDELRATGRLERELATLEWYIKFGEIYEPAKYPGTNADYLRSIVIYRLLRVLMMDDSPEKVRTMRHFVRWMDNALGIAPGWLDTIKPDFVGYHHRGIYANAYAPHGFHGAALVVYLLHGTPFALSGEAVQNLRNALLTARILAHKYDVPTAVNGRFPFSTAALNSILPAYAYMALSSDPMDGEMAAAFMRLWEPDSDYLRKDLFPSVQARIMFLNTFGSVQMMTDLAERDIAPEPPPSGHWHKPYGALSVHRRDDWMVSVKGWSKYVWNAEMSEKGENPLGRYLSCGTVLIYGRGEPVNPAASGYVQRAWDWNHWPGTTAIHLSHEELGHNSSHRDLTDQTFVGGVSLEGRNGVFAMRLHDTVYDTSFWADKSVFCFEDRLICLGAGIRNGDAAHTTLTTLFQCGLAGDDPGPTRVNSAEGITEIPFRFLAEGDRPVWLMDSAGNGYFVPKPAGMHVVRRVQEPGKVGREGGGRGAFEVAWIDHGSQPDGAGYEYAVLVQSDAERVAAFSADPDYEVWQRDHRAHVVHCKSLNITGYALFEGAPEMTRGIVRSADRPCLAMVGRKPEGIVLSVADPDFGWSWKIAEPHRHNTLIPDQLSRARELRVTLNGGWRPAEDAPGAEVVEVSAGRTEIAFVCQDGLTVEIPLKKTR